MCGMVNERMQAYIRLKSFDRQDVFRLFFVLTMCA